MEIKNLAAALVKAQAAMTGAKKDSANPFFKSKYADLSSVDAAIGPALEAHGLGYVQISHESDKGASIETVIIHSSGETLSCGVVTVPLGNKADAQGYGSAMTYARRYSLSAAFGVCPEDDDGNAAAKAAANAAAKAAPKKEASISPNDVGKDYWNNAEGEEAEFLNQCLKTVTDLLLVPDAVAAEKFYVDIGSLEERAAVWSQLDSKQRKAIKSAKDNHAATP